MKPPIAPEEVERYDLKGDGIAAVVILLILIGAFTVGIMENLRLLETIIY